MDILLISRCPPFPLQFGDRLIPYHLARSLSERRHAIDLLAFYDSPEDIAEIPRYESYFRSVQLIHEPSRGTTAYLRRLTGGHFFPETARESWSAEMWQAIEAHLALGHYTAVHLFGGIQVYEYRELTRRNANLIVPYESYSLYLRRATAERAFGPFGFRQRLELALTRQYERRMFVGFDSVVVLSEVDAQSLRALQPGLPIRVIPNGVDTDYFTPSGQEPDEPTLAFVGNYEYPPNVDAALRLARRVFPLVQKQVPRTRLLLIGRNPPDELRRLQSEAIEVTGSVLDVRPYLEQTLIFVSPLQIGAGIKNKLLEAMAMQKAIVATPLSCDGIDVKHEEHLLIADGVEGIADAVMRLMRDGDLRQRLALAGRELIEKRYTWRGVAQQYEVLYRELALVHTRH